MSMNKTVQYRTSGSDSCWTDWKNYAEELTTPTQLKKALKACRERREAWAEYGPYEIRVIDTRP